MRRWLLPIGLGIVLLLGIGLWLMYELPVAPVLVVRISPISSGVIKAKAIGRVDEKVFYDRVSSWGKGRVETCYEIAGAAPEAEVREWALIAIGHAGTKADIERLQQMIASGKLAGSDADAARHAIGVLKGRYRF